ncbi:hypothetical protein HXX76_008148 [Chlamydomonas incerta]|uniref:Uncharacterized protein n=1 Tax=Chlamydomonas incerta TaxID=51695 RepID=A0A835T918_CHLIN|nr:hypothetical protein HXX76_008148 [Chlamydomonas incerta]|eukprot:KAG2433790.1 hypothetical protein HXX76_008148 [Chlamydomonas incerta]
MRIRAQSGAAPTTLILRSGRASDDVPLSGLDGFTVPVDRSPCVSFQAEDVALLTSGAGELLGLVTVRSGAAAAAQRRPSGVTLMRLDIRLLPRPRRTPALDHAGTQAPPLSPDSGVFFARPAPMAPVAPARSDAGGRHGGRQEHAGRQLHGDGSASRSTAAEAAKGGVGLTGGASLLDAASDAGAAAAVSAGVAGRTGNDTYPVANVMVSLSRRVPDACPSRVPALRAAAAVDCHEPLLAAGEESPAHAGVGAHGVGSGDAAGSLAAPVLRRASMLVEVPTSLFRCAPDDTEQISRSFFVQLRVDVSRRQECGADDSEPAYAGEAANEISPGCSYLIVTGECKPESCPPPPPPPVPEQLQLQLQPLQHQHQTLQAADPLEPGQQQQAAEARQLLSMAEAVAAAAAAAVAAAGPGGAAEVGAGPGAAAEAAAGDPHNRRAVSDLAQEVVPADGDGIGIGSGVSGVGGGSEGAGEEGARRKGGDDSRGLLAVVLHSHGPALDEGAPAAATAADAAGAEAGAEAAAPTTDAAEPREPGTAQGTTGGPPGAAALLDPRAGDGSSSAVFDTSGSVTGISPAFAGMRTAASGDLCRPSWDGKMGSNSGSGTVAYAQAVLARSSSSHSNTTTGVVGAVPAATYNRSGSSNSTAAAGSYNRTGSSNSASAGGAVPIVVISRDSNGDGGSDAVPLSAGGPGGARALLGRVGSGGRGSALAGSAGGGVPAGLRPQLLCESAVATATSSPTPSSYVPHSMHASFSGGPADVYSPRRSRWLPTQAAAAAATAGAAGAAGGGVPGSPHFSMSQSFTQGYGALQAQLAAGVLSPRPQPPPSSPAYPPGTQPHSQTSSNSSRRRYVGNGDAAAAAAGTGGAAAAAASASSSTAAGPPRRTPSAGRLATIFSTSDEALPALPADVVAAMQQQVYEREEVYERQLQQQQQQQAQQQELQAQHQGPLAPLGLQPLGRLRDGSEPQSGSTGAGQEPPAAPRQASSSAASSLSWAVGGNGSGSTPRIAARGAKGGFGPAEPFAHTQELRQQQQQDAMGSATSTYSRFSASAGQSRQASEPGGGAASEPGAAADAAAAPPGSAATWDVGVRPRQAAFPAPAAPFSPNYQQYDAPGGGRNCLTDTASAMASPLRPAGGFARSSMPMARTSVPASPSQQLQAHRLPDSLLAQLQPLGSPVTPPSAAARAAKQRFVQQQQRRLESGAKRVGGAMLGAFDSAATGAATDTAIAMAGQQAARAPTHGAPLAQDALIGGTRHSPESDSEEAGGIAAFTAAADAAAATAAFSLRGALSPLHRHEVLDEALLPASGPATAQHDELQLGSDGGNGGAGTGEGGEGGFASAALSAGPPLSMTGSLSGGEPDLARRASSTSTSLAAAVAAAAVLQQQPQPQVRWPSMERAAGATQDGSTSSAVVAARWSQSAAPGGAPLVSQGSISVGGGVAISLQHAFQQDLGDRAAQHYHLQQQRPQHSSAHGEHAAPRRAATKGKSFQRLMGGGAVGSSPTTLDGSVGPPHPCVTHTTGGGPAAAAPRMGAISVTPKTASPSSTPPLNTRTSASGSGLGMGARRGGGGGTPPLQPSSGVQSAAATAPTSPYALVGVTAAYAPGRERAYASGDVECPDSSPGRYVF